MAKMDHLSRPVVHLASNLADEAQGCSHPSAKSAHTILYERSDIICSQSQLSYSISRALPVDTGLPLLVIRLIKVDGLDLSTRLGPPHVTSALSRAPSNPPIRQESVSDVVVQTS